jgi:hypothetical protein
MAMCNCIVKGYGLSIEIFKKNLVLNKERKKYNPLNP